jgi:hypothetical protein
VVVHIRIIAVPQSMSDIFRKVKVYSVMQQRLFLFGLFIPVPTTRQLLVLRKSSAVAKIRRVFHARQLHFPSNRMMIKPEARFQSTEV